jgi:hypothetical protein
MVIIFTILQRIAAAHRHPLCLARWLFWQRERGDYVKKLTQMKTLTSVLLMIVIQIVIWMYYSMIHPKQVRLIVATSTPAGPDGRIAAR